MVTRRFLLKPFGRFQKPFVFRWRFYFATFEQKKRRVGTSVKPKINRLRKIRQSSSGPFGTGMCSRNADGGYSRMNDATSGAAGTSLAIRCP